MAPGRSRDCSHAFWMQPERPSATRVLTARRFRTIIRVHASPALRGARYSRLTLTGAVVLGVALGCKATCVRSAHRRQRTECRRSRH